MKSKGCYNYELGMVSQRRTMKMMGTRRHETNQGHGWDHWDGGLAQDSAGRGAMNQ